MPLPLFRHPAGRALAGTLLAIGLAAPASAQWYGRPYDPPVYEYEIIRPPARIPGREFGAIARADFGFRRIDRLVRTPGSHVVDGIDRDGRKVRLIFDAHTGALADRIVLERPPAPRPKVARTDPPDARPAPRPGSRSPERPAVLAPRPAARPPAAIVPVSPAAPLPPPPPAPPAEALAPATVVPPGLPVVVPGAAIDRPAVVVPVRPAVPAERRGGEVVPPPLAGVTPPPAVTVPPALLDDATPKPPAAPAPQVPVTPLD